MPFIAGHEIHLAMPEPLPPGPLVGHDEELALCALAWGVDLERNRFTPARSSASPPLSFRLHAPTGVGKKQVVFELARRLRMDLYIVAGHEDLTPEDLALVLVPAEHRSRRSDLVLRASPLASAIYSGQLLCFDNINRVPERTLSLLAPVLDGRQRVYSSLAGVHIGARDSTAARTFRFCSTLDPQGSYLRKPLPDYIAQRCVPMITLKPLTTSQLATVAQLGSARHAVDLGPFKHRFLGESRRQCDLKALADLLQYTVHEHMPDEATARALLHGLAMNERLHGPEHPDVQRIRAELAAHFCTSDNFRASETLWRQVIAIEAAKRDLDHRIVERARLGLAAVYCEQSRLHEANTALQELLDGQRQAMSDDDPELAATLNQLGIIHRRMAHYDEAAQYYSEALRILRAQLSPASLAPSNIQGNIATMYWYAGRFREARPLLEEALHWEEQARGIDHPENATRMNTLARLLLSIGRVDEARALYERTKLIRESDERTPRSDLAFTYDGLAQVAAIERREADAIHYADLGLAIRETAYGAKHPLTAASLLTMGRVLHRFASLDRAAHYYELALSTATASLLEGHPDIAVCQGELARLHIDRGDVAAAKTLIEKAYASLVTAIGRDRPQAAEVLKERARLALLSSRFVAAERLAGQAQRFLRAELEPTHPSLVDVRSLLKTARASQRSKSPREAACDRRRRR